MDNEYTPDIVTLVDDDNVEHSFEILDIIECEEGVFYALTPIYDSAEESLSESSEYYIMEKVEEDGEEFFVEVEDEALCDKLAQTFEKHFEEMFDFGGDEEE